MQMKEIRFMEILTVGGGGGGVETVHCFKCNNERKNLKKN